METSVRVHTITLTGLPTPIILQSGRPWKCEAGRLDQMKGSRFIELIIQKVVPD